MRINAVEQELLVPEIVAFSRALRDPEARAPYDALRVAVEEGEVEDGLLGHLGNVLEIGLQSGRLRRFYGADGEQALSKLFHRTPSGTRLAQMANGVTQALSGLQGQTIEEIKVSALDPGAYGITLDTDRCQISVRLDRAGVEIDNVAIGI